MIARPVFRTPHHSDITTLSSIYNIIYFRPPTETNFKRLYWKISEQNDVYIFKQPHQPYIDTEIHENRVKVNDVSKKRDDINNYKRIVWDGQKAGVRGIIIFRFDPAFTRPALDSTLCSSHSTTTLL